jgi:ribosome-associated protein
MVREWRIPIEAESPTVSPIDEQSPERGQTRALALEIADILTDTPASDTRVLDIATLTPIADFFVLCSGENERQLRAISREVTDTLASRQRRPQRTEGSADSGWILIDYGDVVVHIFAIDQRSFYRLDELWSEAPTLLAIQ